MASLLDAPIPDGVGEGLDAPTLASSIEAEEPIQHAWDAHFALYNYRANRPVRLFVWRNEQSSRLEDHMSTTCRISRTRMSTEFFTSVVFVSWS